MNEAVFQLGDQTITVHFTDASMKDGALELLRAMADGVYAAGGTSTLITRTESRREL